MAQFPGLMGEHFEFLGQPLTVCAAALDFARAGNTRQRRLAVGDTARESRNRRAKN